MSTRGAQIVKLLIRLLITAGLLVWVFGQIDLGQFRQAIHEARWEYLVAVCGLTLVLTWIQSVKMRLVLQKQDCVAGTETIFAATAISSFYSLILPGILSTGVKWYVLKKNTGNGSKVFSSMVYNQFATLIIVTLFGLAAIMISNPTSLLIPNATNQWLLPAICGVALAIVLLVTLLLMNARTGGKVIEVLRFPLSPLPERIRQKAGEILDQLAIFQTAGWRFHTIFVLVTIMDTLIGGVVSYILAARTAHIAAPMSVFVWLCALVYILGRIPISMANLGVREVTLVGFLAVYGVEKPAAMLMSMILFSTIVLLAVIGVACQLFWMLTAKKTTRPV